MQAYHGIDVSYAQGKIDWQKVKAAGIQFAFVRCGYSRWDGSVKLDEQYHRNMQEAAKAGMPVGIYLYSYAKTPEAAARAASETLALAKDYRVELPVALDLEDELYRANTAQENTDIARAFLETVRGNGYYPLFYTYKSFAETLVQMASLKDFDFWLAHYTSQTSYTGPYTVWQYTSKGRVEGISGTVDCNFCELDYPEKIRTEGKNHLTGQCGLQERYQSLIQGLKNLLEQHPD